jgi:hypothetical protein
VQAVAAAIHAGFGDGIDSSSHGLLRGVDALMEIPFGRWDKEAYNDPEHSELWD